MRKVVALVFLLRGSPPRALTTVARLTLIREASPGEGPRRDAVPHTGCRCRIRARCCGMLAKPGRRSKSRQDSGAEGVRRRSGIMICEE